MLKRNVFMDVMLKRFVRANRIPAVHSPLIPPLSKLGRRESGEALNAFERTENARVGFWEMPLARAALFLLLAALTLSAQAGMREVGAIGLTVGDLDRELIFYTNTMPFELVSISEASSREQGALLGLSDVKLRVAMLKLGDERITLHKLTLEGAKKVGEAAAKFAKDNGAGPSIAVVDDGGYLLYFVRPEESFAAGANVSIGKARTSAIFKKPTKDFEDTINKGRFTMTALPDFTPLQGGVPIMHEGQVIGAVGVSGAKSAQQDEEVAQADAAAISATKTASK